MKLTCAILVCCVITALARERPVDSTKHEQYASGEVMERIMKVKEATWQRNTEQGRIPKNYASYNAYAPCVNGVVKLGSGTNSTFECKNLDVTGFLTHTDLGSTDTSNSVGSSIWGHTIDGREFIAIGQSDGAAFAEIVGKGWWNNVPFYGKAEGTLDYLGRLPYHSVPSLWREIKGYKNYAIIGSEAVGHGIQIFDFHKLLELRRNRLSTATKVFSTTTDVYHFADLPVGRSHNVVMAEASEHILAVGSQPRNDSCAAGLIFIDMKDPSRPTRTGCAKGDGYVHDAQCLIYHGPDTKYEGTEICYGYNEDSLTIYNVTDKTTTNIISKTSYDGASYTHQGWVLDPNNQAFLLLDDEFDEYDKNGAAADQRATTYIWNIASLESPVLTGYHKSDIVSIDHNQYINNMFSYQSNYGSGLRILDVSSVPTDPTGSGIQEVAFIDIYPEDDEAPIAEFSGTWSNYPYFKSGHIPINTFERGVFVVKRSKEVGQGIRAEF
ncbi:hypothetical protein AMATHDRAFT_72294 [Amanita thiersii Skay4041]|uniref:Choice-of-anchor B family protein n=1 Tax=Amanita thiersii Skay4041 TaxID=703135 RepID=A0A2A9P1C3_9AGAR|nr:hypothetical protein AMATHDRAFT_72294 [Amanita thiersii Skay4041]